MEEQAASLPVYVTASVWSAILIFILIWVWRLRDSCSAFLLLVTWLRYCLANFHEYTYLPIFAGLSLIALTSISTVALGFFVLGLRALFLRRLRSLYSVIAVILVSTIANQEWVGGLNATFKWLYLIVFALAIYRAVRRRGPERISRAMAIIFVGPIALQWMSVAFDVKSVTTDGVTHFIGGYSHMQNMSIILLTFLFVTCMSVRLSVFAVFARLVVIVVGLVIANYRTSIFAGALPAASLFVSNLVSKIVPKQRGLGWVFASIIIIFVGVVMVDLEQERFADIGSVLEKEAGLIQPSSNFTEAERLLFSSRIYIWSQYIEAYLDGDIRNIVIGFGPEVWVKNFTLYAHNTFIAYLYELGLAGVAALLWVLISNLLSAMGVASKNRLILISCHMGFIILNLSTMGLWTIEGTMMYGLIIGYTWSLQAVEDRGREVGFPPAWAALP